MPRCGRRARPLDLWIRALPASHPVCWLTQRSTDPHAPLPQVEQLKLQACTLERLAHDATGILQGRYAYARELACAILGDGKCRAAFLDAPLEPSYAKDGARAHGDMALPVAFGDRMRPRASHTPCWPLVGKARWASPAAEASTILFKMARIRHYGSFAAALKLDTLEFQAKRPLAVWRGSPTDSPAYWRRGHARLPHRVRLLVQNSSLIDVALSTASSQEDVVAQYIAQEGLRVSPLSIAEQLQYAMIIVLEGNDVATSLKWALASSSAVLMPKPTRVSWLMEDQLLPYVHYIPLRADFRDVHTQAAWCVKHPQRCRKIGLNGRCFARQFLDSKREAEVQRRVLMGAFEAARRAGVCFRNAREN